MFVTKEQLDELGLSALIGTPTLRAYMHGFLIDARLYNKANTLTRPFAYDNYKKNKVKELLHKEREQETIKKPTNLPKVGRINIVESRARILDVIFNLCLTS